MKNYIGKLFIMEGIILGIIGILFFINPMESLIGFTLAIGILIMLAAGFKITRGWYSPIRLYCILSGTIDILFGLILIFSPIATIETLLVFYGMWSLIRGIFNLVIYIKDKTFGFNFKSISCLVDILIGMIVVLCPIILIVTLPFIPYILGVYFIFLAISEIYLGWKI